MKIQAYLNSNFRILFARLMIFLLKSKTSVAAECHINVKQLHGGGSVF